MSSKYEERVEELKKQKRADEKIECVAMIDGKPRLLLFIAVAIVSFVLGRVYAGHFAVLMVTNVLSMWMMVDAARVLVDTQEACLIITSRRIYGKAGRDIDLRYKDILEVQNTPSGIFIKAGASHRSIMLRYITNKEEGYSVLKRHI